MGCAELAKEIARRVGTPRTIEVPNDDGEQLHHIFEVEVVPEDTGRITPGSDSQGIELVPFGVLNSRKKRKNMDRLTSKTEAILRSLGDKL